MTPIHATFPTTPTSQRESAMFRYTRSLVVLGMVVTGLLVAAPSAFAGRVHVFGSTFAEEGSGAGQLKEPSGIAVNEVTLANAGDVYVADTANNRVEFFSAEGKELKGGFNGAGTPAGSFSSPSAIAVDNSTDPLDPSAGDVYVTDFGHSVVDKFTPEGAYLGQIATGAGGGALGEIDGVAVDPEGLVWVYQGSGQIDDYSDAASNVFLASRESPFGAQPGFAVDSEDHLYVRRGEPFIAKLTSSGENLDESVNPGENATAAAVNASDDVFIDENATIGMYDLQTALIERFGEGHLSDSHGVAVDSASGTVYATNRENGTVTAFTAVPTPSVLTGEASELSVEGSATLKGTVNPEGVEVSTCRFEYGLTAAYGSVAECTPEPGSGSSPVSVSTSLSGLKLGRYHFRLIAANANGETVGADQTFIATGHPVISEQTLASVDATTANITAQLNAGGLATSYQVQYGTSTAYGSSTPLENAGAGFSTGVQVSLSGLAPATGYHARLVASNKHGSVAGPDIAFTTTVGASASASNCPNKTNAGFSPLLPDCRAYEAVSPSGGPGEVYVPAGPGSVTARLEDIITEQPMRAAVGGDAVAYIAESGEEGGDGNTGRGLGNQFIATRDAPQHRWDVVPITPQAGGADEPAANPIYEAFSDNLSVGIFGTSAQAFTAQATPAGPRPCNVLYSRTSDDDKFHALFTETRTPGFCGLTPGESESLKSLMFAGGNAGTAGVAPYSHLLFQSPAPLTEGTVLAEAEGEGRNLYESVDGVTQPASVLPDGEVDANAIFGGASREREPGEKAMPDFENVVSTDGSHVFWTDLGSGRIYMRLNSLTTVPISEGPAKYWSATPDGKFVLYSEGERLLRYDTQAPSGAEREELAGTGVQGVVGTSENGSYVYFVASGVLAAGAEARRCQKPGDQLEELQRNGEPTIEERERLLSEQREEFEGHLPKARGCNLYVHHEGVTTFVAALGAHDNQLTRTSGFLVRLGVWEGELSSRTAQVADDGRELVFQSTQQLTGYDNSSLDERGPEYGLEVFAYDASTDRLTCASCAPSGAPPAQEVRGVGGGTYLPVSLNLTSMRRWVSKDGSRVFFDSSQPLVPQDSNGAQDVYEWEREGTVGCPRATSRWGGCVSLLSGGNSSDHSFFVDASADGGDVFFTHRGQLGGQGRPGLRTELFDVRANGGFPESSTACTGTGCQGVPPAPPVFATPSSVTFNGVGNFSPLPSRSSVVKKTAAQLKAERLAKAFRACKRDRSKKKRATCEKTSRKKYGMAKKAKRANRATKDRRAQS